MKGLRILNLNRASEYAVQSVMSVETTQFTEASRTVFDIHFLNCNILPVSNSFT
jgi:hypothetical protein